MKRNSKWEMSKNVDVSVIWYIVGLNKGYERGWPEQRDGWRSSRMEEEVSTTVDPWRARMNSRAPRQKEKKKKKNSRTQ